MFGANSRIPFGLGAIGSALGLWFGWASTSDYAAHLDRQLHDLHCSYVPGAAATSEAEACRAALYSPYSALLKDQYWGGVPISLFAVGAFAFILGFALYLAFAGGRAPKKAVVFFGLVGLTPLLVSGVMFFISLTKLGTFCKTCVGIYVGSFVLALGALLGFMTLRGSGATGPTGTIPGTPYDPPADAPRGRPAMSLLFPLAWLAALGIWTATPAYIYTTAIPNHRAHLDKCGKLNKPKDEKNSLLKVAASRAVQPVTFFEDPLCPTCKAFHDRLVGEGIFPKLDVTLVMFPLDSECNWMLDHSMHPGACTVAKAVLCGDTRALSVLEWSFENQEELTAAGKAGKSSLVAAIERRWGADMVACIDKKETEVRLNNHLHYATDNAIPVSTPQMFIGTQRVCEEDTDIGLVYTIAQLAPQVMK